jgi:hypothetical protein
MCTRRDKELFNLLAAAGKKSAALVLMLALVSGTVSAQNQPTLVPVGSIPHVMTEYSWVLNPTTNKIYVFESGVVSVFNLNTGALTVVAKLISGFAPSWFKAIAVNPVTNRVYVGVDQGIAVINGDTDAVLTTVSVPQLERQPSYGDAREVAVNTLNNQIFVAGNSGAFVQIDGASAKVVASTTLGALPNTLSINERADIIYVGYQQGSGRAGTISAISSTTNPFNNPVILSVMDYPSGTGRDTADYSMFGAFNPLTKKLYYTHHSAALANQVSELDIPSGKVTSIPIPGAADHLVINSATNKIYTKSGETAIAVIDGMTRQVSTVPIGSPGHWHYIALNERTDKIYVSAPTGVSIIDGPTNAVTEVRNLPEGLHPFVTNPLNGRTFLPVDTRLIEVVVPPPPDAEAIEVTQSVQDLSQSVPLIAGRETLVRVYARSSGTAAMTGTLTVLREGAATLTVQSSGSMTPTRDDLAKRRGDLSKSLNFVLPADATREGRIRVTLSALSDGRNFGDNGCAGCSRVVTFQPPLEMRVRVIGLKYRDGTMPEYAPRDIDFNVVESWLKRAYPISSLTFSHKTVSYTGALIHNDPDSELFKCEDANAQVSDLRNQEMLTGSYDARTHYYGLVYDQDGATGSFFMVGCSRIVPFPDPSVAASGPAGSGGSLIRWDTGPSYGGWYAGHELGHSLGRYHAGPVFTDSKGEFAPCATFDQMDRCLSIPCSIAVEPDHNFPYPGSQLTGLNRAAIGYDRGDTANSLNIAPLAMASPKWHDTMSYCDYVWPSDYMYEALIERLRAENALPAHPPFVAAAMSPSQPGAAGLPAAASRAAGAPMLAGLVAATPRYVKGDFVTIIGTADVSKKTGTIGFVHRVQQAKLRPADQSSPVRLRLIDRAGRIIEELPVPFLPNSDHHPGEDARGIVDAVIPAAADLAAVELVVAGNLAARYEAPATAHTQSTDIRTSAPRATAQAVTPGPARRLEIEWGSPRVTAAAVAPGAVRYDVQASRDGGQTWEVLANGLPSPSTEVDLTDFGNVREIELRIIANEGFESKEIARRKVER